MKAVKIILPIVVVITIAFFVIRSMVLIDKVDNIALPRNQFADRIEKEIDSISKFPDSKFCPGAYEHVLFLIEDYSKPNPPQYPYGRLGKTQSERDQWKDNLSRNVYSIYSGKFINQAFFVFRGSQWRNDDLKFIRSEYQTLRNAQLLERGGPVDNKFMEIKTILAKYDEISGFIAGCNRFSYPSYNSRDRFPFSEVKEKIARASKYLYNRLENQYVNNCSRLHDGLKEVPQVLFRAHISYLDNKIDHLSNRFSDYRSQREYANLLYNPMKNEIGELDNSIYKVADFDREFNRLTDKWSADNKKAYNYNY